MTPTARVKKGSPSTRKPPRFSVVFPLHPNKALALKSLDSILGQTFGDFEILAVGEGAKTARLPRDRRIRLIPAKGPGISAARNSGVAAARGAYIAFLDPGDGWEPDFLLTLQKLILDFPGEGLYGTNYWVYEKGKKRENPVRLPRGWRGRRKNFYGLMLYGRPPFCASSAALPTTLARQNPFPEGILAGEDLLVWFKVSLKHGMAYVKKPLSNYRLGTPVNPRGVYFGPLKHLDWLTLGRRLKKEGQLSKEAEKFTLWATLLQVRKMIANGRKEQALELWARCPKNLFIPYQAYLWCLAFLSPGVWKIFQPGVKIARWMLTGRFFSRRAS
jgi:glycosyltransferase involved in cell wall biosynthesis